MTAKTKNAKTKKRDDRSTSDTEAAVAAGTVVAQPAGFVKADYENGILEVHVPIDHAREAATKVPVARKR